VGVLGVRNNGSQAGLRLRAALVACLAAALACGAALAATEDAAAKRKSPTRKVLFVGNNWDGTADVIALTGKDRYRRLARLSIVPDRQQRLSEILLDPVRLVFYLAIRTLIGEGHDQYVDDLYSTPDGRLLIVSRPSFGDVVGIRIATGEIAWRFRVAGYRADHMAMSPDGKHVAVSASTGNVVHVLKARTGEEVFRFPSGDSPHENVYSKDGKRIYHASIGLVYTPLDSPLFDTSKGERYFQIVDARTGEILKRLDMGLKLAEAGYPDMSSAVRPMTFSPNERYVYFQVSFFHGFVEYDLKKDKVLRVANLPLAPHVRTMPRENYLLDSAHHGIAMNRKGTRLCVAGTMSDYVAIVSRKTFGYKLIHGGLKPYWVTNDLGGNRCFVSWSGSNAVSVISYAKRKEVARFDVGYHPQRMRIGEVRRNWLKTLR